MFWVQKINYVIYNKALKKSLPHFREMSHHIRLDQFSKRGLILEKMVADKDKRKNWHFNIMANKNPKCRNVFEKVHRPSRRQNVLNSLFIKNITDVVSTGDVAPEILGYGVEITGVKISPCCKILNVFWQIPIKHDGTAEEIAEHLCKAAPKIRAEMISRNVMGRIPRIYFLRDGTNARIAAFEEALMKLDLPKDSESTVVPDETFLEDMYRFRRNKVKRETHTNKTTKNEEKVCEGIPENPPDMKSDIFGLKHDMIMGKVLASKKKVKEPQQSAVITTQMLQEGDLFSKIPGVCFRPDNIREKILKNFQIERKKLMQKKDCKLHEEDLKNYEEDDADECVLEPTMFEDDFVEEEEVTDNSKI